jgi:Tfp pilus assembly pilus retraction ATPase PilT
LIATPAVRECLKAKGRLDELRTLMDDGGESGMQTFQQHLAALVTDGRVAPDTALAAEGAVAANASASAAAQPGKRGGKHSASA